MCEADAGGLASTLRHREVPDSPRESFKRLIGRRGWRSGSVYGLGAGEVDRRNSHVFVRRPRASRFRSRSGCAVRTGGRWLRRLPDGRADRLTATPSPGCTLPPSSIAREGRFREAAICGYERGWARNCVVPNPHQGQIPCLSITLSSQYRSIVTCLNSCTGIRRSRSSIALIEMSAAATPMIAA